MYSGRSRLNLQRNPAKGMLKEETMITSLVNVTLLVKDYDEAIRWYTEKLGLELRMDG